MNGTQSVASDVIGGSTSGRNRKLLRNSSPMGVNLPGQVVPERREGTLNIYVITVNGSKGPLYRN